MTAVTLLRSAREKALAQLESTASAYVEVYGHPQGLHELGEDLCRIVAQKYNPTNGWTELVQHIMKISG